MGAALRIWRGMEVVIKAGVCGNKTPVKAYVSQGETSFSGGHFHANTATREGLRIHVDDVESHRTAESVAESAISKFLGSPLDAGATVGVGHDVWEYREVVYIVVDGKVSSVGIPHYNGTKWLSI